ncbi:cytochrome ubiquinol oxidase subunit I [Escherichia coli]|nr:cytochrome ubiquinol oxidase subunit I [Escherichia coli]
MVAMWLPASGNHTRSLSGVSSATAFGEKKWLLRAALYGIPAAVDCCRSEDWFVAEYGRQPWAIGEVLPTAVANSSLTIGDLIFSMVLICGLYTLFLVARIVPAYVQVCTPRPKQPELRSLSL